MLLYADEMILGGSMHRLIQMYIICACLAFSSISHAANQQYHQTFNKLFSAWTNAFNHKELQAACDLFAKSVVADYRDTPQKNYQMICDGFKKVFSDASHRYRYRFKLHDIYQSGNLAVARITWYLEIYQGDILISTTQDEGIDIFQQNEHGQWQIIMYLAYDKPPDCRPGFRCK
jgi:ketosteroid isomerase-like protein